VAADETQVEVAKVQSLFREVNEHVAECARDRSEYVEFVCECRRESCAALIPLLPEEYEAVRLIPTHFVVAPGHADRAVERVVAAEERYEVVEMYGAGGLAALKFDPRRRRWIERARMRAS
jgi:hypothetical protein